MKSPLIAIVADQKPMSSGPWRNVLTDGNPHTYIHAVTAGGGAPILFPTIPAFIEHPDTVLDMVAGLFLPGGRDIESKQYGQTAHKENDPPFTARDELEIALVQAATARGMPVFGACRGMQIINVALGGGLEQHLGDRLDLTPHRDTVGEFTTHEVRISPGSVLANIVGDAPIQIASHHHQAVAELAPGLVATAWAPDGVIEAIESSGDAERPPGAPSFCLGVQWHPEQRLDTAGRKLMTAFVSEADKFARINPQ